ncbi:MAG: DUF4214 domain-containing protein [Acidimicrobiales bacterium]
MRRHRSWGTRRLAGLTVGLVAAGVVLVTPSPASADGVTATPSGGTLNVSVTGSLSVQFGCFSGLVGVNGTTVSPSLACNALTLVVVTGDSGGQTIFGNQLGEVAFSADPSLTATTNDGADLVYGSPRADAISLGGGDDTFVDDASTLANTSVDLGSGSNTWQVQGLGLDDQIGLAASGSTATAHIHNAEVTVDLSASPVQTLVAQGGGGADVIDATSVSTSSTVTQVRLAGDAGTNALTGGNVATDFDSFGGTATMSGGTAGDTFHSSSTADVIHGGGGPDQVYDVCCGRTGGRPTDDAGGSVTYSVDLHGNDGVARLRPDPRYGLGATTLATSLHRTGLSEWPAEVDHVQLFRSWYGAIDTAGIFDVVAPSDASTPTVYLAGDSFHDDLIDITIPTGSWTVAGSADTQLVITPQTAGVAQVTVSNSGPYKVHGPWANKNQGFAHRVQRDLLFAFPTNAARDAIRDKLAAGTTTRAAVVSGIVNSDTYRGLDVDRVYRRFLKRQADPGGRSSWISAIRNGKSLRKFRAQLFGSNEYFTKAGGTTTGFVRAAYQDVLGRLPDAGGEAYWAHKIDNGMERGAVANYFLSSSEAKRSLVKDQYVRFLDRYPTSGEEATWMAKLDSSATGEQQLVASLAASQAYYDRT